MKVPLHDETSLSKDHMLVSREGRIIRIYASPRTWSEFELKNLAHVRLYSFFFCYYYNPGL